MVLNETDRKVASIIGFNSSVDVPALSQSKAIPLGELPKNLQKRIKDSVITTNTTVNSIVAGSKRNANDTASTSVVDGSEGSEIAESTWRRYVESARRLVHRRNLYTMQIAEMATKATEIHWGGRFREAHTLRDFAKEVGLNEKTLHTWVRVYRNVVQKIIKTDDSTELKELEEDGEGSDGCVFDMNDPRDVAAANRAVSKVDRNATREHAKNEFKKERYRRDHAWRLAQCLRYAKLALNFFKKVVDIQQLDLAEMKEYKIKVSELLTMIDVQIELKEAQTTDEGRRTAV